ncbi:hypothetical protein BC941DRAFT_6691 [Chlamydoabsidia padenii]|nr:hypothetical protein BC941DRAFT_6691 [Chlamydoabsidia padenii]
MNTLSEQQQEIREKYTISVRPSLVPNHRAISAPNLLSEYNQSSNDTSCIIQLPSKSMIRSPRSKSLNDEEKACPPPPLPLQDSFLSHFSTPSRISRSSTNQHLITPELDSEDYSSTFHLTAEFNEKKSKKSSRDLARVVPSKRGVGNIMTILAVIAVIIFLFAGYPLTVYLTRKIHSSPSDQ